MTQATELTLEGLTSARLAERRKTRKQLCSEMGIRSTVTLNSKIRGKTDLSLNEARVLARFLGITIEDICALLGRCDASRREIGERVGGDAA